MRLMDADAAYERAQVDSRRGILEDWEFDVISNLLDSAPTADAAPVVHGEWRTIGANFDRLFCSACGQAALPSVKMLAHFAITFKFCPLCGAKMDGGDPNGR